MNIFALDESPMRAARYHGDRHVIKMILETAQMMCSVFPEGEAPYRRTHFNHPCSVWSRYSYANYEWLFFLGFHLNEEYKFRYRNGNHASMAVIDKCYNSVSTRWFVEDCPRTPFALAMPEKFHSNDPIRAYRAYYATAKRHLHVWTGRPEPEWLADSFRLVRKRRRAIDLSV